MSFAESYLGRVRAALGQVPLLTVGVRLLVEDDAGRFLLLKRADCGRWGLPAGSMEPGESLLDAAHREAREEANVTLRDVQPFGLSSDPLAERHVYPNGDEVQAVVLLIHARMEDGPLRANDGEALAFRMLRVEEMVLSEMVPAERPTFGHWDRYRQSGQFQIV